MIEVAPSTPSFNEFDPSIIKYQGQVIDGLWHDFDYSLGCHEVLLSGSVGSAKSILASHAAVRHCIENVAARVCLCRRSMPDLKSTIFGKIVEHLENSELQEGVDYWINQTQAKITFRNRSEIISRSWADKRYMKFRSIELSGAIFEELTENDIDDRQAYFECKMRVGRLPAIKQNFMISCTNPDGPEHWVYEYFQLDRDDRERKSTLHVYYSVTTDNPFLPPQYVAQLKEDLDPKTAQRMIYGRWVTISTEKVYHQYSEVNRRIDEDYKINIGYPIHASWDFNIGDSKPLSLIFFQFISDVMHVFAEVIIEGMRTEGSCDEAAGRGMWDHPVRYIIHGDATGRNRDTRNLRSDYSLIKAYLSNHKTDDGRKVQFEIQVPMRNPALRKRHNTVNAYLGNANGRHRLFVYKGAPTVDRGLRLTALKKGGQYIEDDGPNCPYQHCTTALGYGLCKAIAMREEASAQGMRQL